MNKKRVVSGYIRDYYTAQLLQINHYFRIPITQPGFNGKLYRVFLVVAQLIFRDDEPFVNKNTMLLQEIIFLLRLVSTRKAPAENGNGFIDPY